MLNKLSWSEGWALVVAVILFSALVGVAIQAEAQETGFDYSSQDLRVGVWIEGLEEGDVLERGEEINVGFQTNEDAFAVVYRINTDGEVTVLWPRSRLDDGFVFAGHEYMLPVSGSRRLVASSSSGEGFIEAIVSRYPFDLRDLQLDFHHEYTAEMIEYSVVGDPFLAMNEINFAVTGLEDSEDYVVTNYLGYFVHQEVEHPRYLCNQCHLDEEIAIRPYLDTCPVDISYDYSWGNDWYDNYGYYPVYQNPVYVYVDPWTFKPWVNFWYYPSYSCPPWQNHHWGSPAYVWCDSPYYRYDGVRVKTGRGRYPSLAGDGTREQTRYKTSDYSRVSGRIATEGPSNQDRDLMVRKESDPRRSGTQGSAGHNGGVSARPDNNRASVVGGRPGVRSRPVVETSTERTTRGGLQIRKPGTGRKVDTAGNSQRLTRPIRSGSGSSVNTGRGGSLVPVRGSSSGGNQSGNSTVRGSSRNDQDRSTGVRPSRNAQSDRKIKPVEPRKKGTRIWNSGGDRKTSERKVRSTGRSSSSSSSSGSRSSTVKPTRKSGTNSSAGKTSSGSRGKSSSSGSSSVKSKSSGSSSGSKSSSKSSSRSGSSGKSSSKSGRSSGSSRGKR